MYFEDDDAAIGGLAIGILTGAGDDGADDGAGDAVFIGVDGCGLAGVGWGCGRAGV